MKNFNAREITASMMKALRNKVVTSTTISRYREELLRAANRHQEFLCIAEASLKLQMLRELVVFSIGTKYVHTNYLFLRLFKNY